MITQATQGSIKTPKTLEASSVSKLNERLKDEYGAHYFYRNAHNWCAGEGYLKAAAFFAEEAETELEHAKGIQKYLVDWNSYPSMPSIKANITFTNLIDIVNKAYQIEYALYEAYIKDSKELFASDLNTFDFLTGYRIGQNQSVIEYSDLLNAAMLVNVENNFEVLYFEQTYFKGN
jgi:ferritin